MYDQPNYDKNGKIISYRLKCSIKNPKTNKFEQKSETWRVPEGLTQKIIVRALKEEKARFRKELEDIYSGKRAECGKGFIEYAREWLEQLKINKSHSYVHRAIESINLFEKEFGQITFDKITPKMISDFYKDLQKKDISKPKVYLKKTLWEEIKKQYGTKNNFCDATNISRTTLLEAENGRSLRKNILPSKMLNHGTIKKNRC